MVFISFIVALFLIAGGWELHLSAVRQKANSKHFAASNQSKNYLQVVFKALHIS